MKNKFRYFVSDQLSFLWKIFTPKLFFHLNFDQLFRYLYSKGITTFCCRYKGCNRLPGSWMKVSRKMMKDLLLDLAIIENNGINNLTMKKEEEEWNYQSHASHVEYIPCICLFLLYQWKLHLIISIMVMIIIIIILENIRRLEELSRQCESAL